MTARRSTRRRFCGLLAPLLATLLLGLRLLAPGAMPVRALGLAALSSFPICHATDSTPAPDAPAVPDGGCGLCPICHLAAGPMLLPYPPETPLPHMASLGGNEGPGQPRGLPDRHRGAASARGPPVPA